MKIIEILSEKELPKDQWVMLISSADKHELGEELVDLVKHAYTNTPQGSFVNSLKDVIPSDWKVIDWDQDPDVDACVFYRINRSNENWVGYKIQGIGHDGQSNSKRKAVEKLMHLIQKNGWWIETSDALRATLKRIGAEPVTDENLLKSLFDDSVTMIDDELYSRVLSNGAIIKETVFGKPILK